MAADPVPPTLQRHDAAQVARGLTRWLHARGHVVLSEVPLPNGRRADLLTLDPRGQVTIVEIKVARADLAGDTKWLDYLDWCDRFFWAVSPDFDLALLDAPERQPERCGLLVADRYDGTLIREAALVPLSSARRRSEHMRLARLAAWRLMQLGDPELAMVADGHQPGF